MTQKQTVTVIKGDGVGPEVVDAALKVLKAADVPLNFEECVAGRKAFEAGITTGVPQETLDSISRNKLVLKGPLETPIGHGGKSANVTIRKLFDMFGNIRPIKEIPAIQTPFSGRGINMVVVRENVEDLYAGIEYMQTPDVAQTLKLISRQGCERIVRLAFEIAAAENRPSVHCVHKANIMKMSEGMLKRVFEEISSDYPNIEAKQVIVDNAAHQLVINPEQFDVLVCTNMNGDILSDQAAGLVGGLGIAASANIGHMACMFESVHGSAPDIAGQGKANPLAFINATILLLKHLGLSDKANLIESALHKTLAEDKKTGDLKPKSSPLSTGAFADAVIDNLGKMAVTKEQNAQTKAVKLSNKISKPTQATKEIVGVDIFVDYEKSLTDLAAICCTATKNTGLIFKNISSRGAVVYPSKGGSIEAGNFLCCRFMAESVLQNAHITNLLNNFKVEWSQIEKLYLFDGERAFSLAQGESSDSLESAAA